jgi:tellurite resistance protein
MTGKAEFSEEEWKQVLEGPTSAGMVVAAATRGGTFRESFSMAKAYAEARKQAGESQLLDEVVSAKPQMDRTRARSPEEMKMNGLENLREAAALLEQKATPEEVEEYKRFLLDLAERVAEAHKDVSDKERMTIEEIAGTLGVSTPEPGSPG